MLHMKSYCSIFLLICCIPFYLQAQTNKSLVSGPWAGNVELRTAMVWAEVSKNVKSVAVKYYPVNNSKSIQTVAYDGVLGKAFNPVKIALNGLDFGTTYQYQLIIDGKPVTTAFETQFKTQDLWQYRKPAPDFSFLAGSCAYFNEPVFDRPGGGYGGDSSIFETMAKTPADFNIWMGDNWYTREVDYGSEWGLNYRASRDRSLAVLQPFMAKMPQYAIWDDHDYGPNDAGKSYLLKEASREVFKNYSLNPTYGEAGEGIYTKVSFGDADFFLTDDRYFRADDKLPDSINGMPNPEKEFFGAKQMSWLKNALLFSRATFKFIVTGSQALNPLNKYECLRDYPVDYHGLMDFLSAQKINGVLFLTGDRHHSEVIRIERPSLYPLFDITVSPLTAGVSKASGIEANNPYRELNTLVEAHNFARLSISGKKNERVLMVAYFGTHGEKLGEWSVRETELRAAK